MSKNKKIAVCGLICSECKIFKAPMDLDIATKLVEFFKEKRENVKLEDFHCNGCRDVVNCWSSTCWIRDCCVNNKNLHYCSECHDFPCDRLKEWATQDKSYTNALQNLQNMKK